MTQENKNHLGERVEIREDSDCVASGVLEEIGIDYDDWNEILPKYNIESWTCHTPTGATTLCLVVNDEEAHIAPLGSVYLTYS